MFCELTGFFTICKCRVCNCTGLIWRWRQLRSSRCLCMVKGIEQIFPTIIFRTWFTEMSASWKFVFNGQYKHSELHYELLAVHGQRKPEAALWYVCFIPCCTGRGAVFFFCRAILCFCRYSSFFASDSRAYRLVLLPCSRFSSVALLVRSLNGVRSPVYEG